MGASEVHTHSKKSSICNIILTAIKINYQFLKLQEGPKSYIEPTRLKQKLAKILFLWKTFHKNEKKN